METLKWALIYLKGSLELGLTFKHNGEGIKLKGYVDDDYASDMGNGKSVVSYVFTICLGSVS